MPHGLSGAEVQRVGVVRSTCDIHETALDERCGLHGTIQPALENPLGSEPGNVAGVDLLELAIAPARGLEPVAGPAGILGECAADQQQWD